MGGNCGTKFAGGFIVALLFVGLAYGASIAFFTGANSGVTVTHNGAPVHDMLVKVWISDGPGQILMAQEPIQSGTTDGTGTYQFQDTTLDHCIGYTQYAYTFAYNGTELVKFGNCHTIAAINV